MKLRIRRFVRLALAVSCILAATSTVRAQERFVAVAEGIKDTQTGLVWGYSYNELYSQTLGDGTVGWPGTFSFDWYGAMTWGVAHYESTSNSLFSRNDEWRLPTIDEVRAAAEAGLFSQYA